MAKNKKFGKLGVNEKYLLQNPDESAKDKEKVAKKGFGGMLDKIKNAANLNKNMASGENNGDSSERFTYTKTTRTTASKKQPAVITKAPVFPMILFLCCMCLSLAGAFFLDTNFVYSKAFGMQCALKIAVSICVYTVPVIVYMFTSAKRRHLYNIRKCSAGFMPLMFVFLGLVLSSSALQKYIIAYVFSYREPVGVQQGSVILACVAGALVPAICEELLFRGVLQYEFSKYAGGAGGVLFTALLFTMLHFDVRFFFVYFVAGLILGTLTHVTKSVFPAMIVHFLNNTFAMFLSDRITFVALERIGGTLLIIVLAALCFILLSAALQMMEKISMKRAVYYLKGGKEEVKDEEEGSEEKGSCEDSPILFTAWEGASVRKTFRLFASLLSIICYVIFLVAVFWALRG